MSEPLTPDEIDALIEAARAVYGEFDLFAGCTAGSCAAALLADDGDIFTGICLDLECGMGFCAEHAAAAEMLKTRRRRVRAMVAVAVGGREIAPPCGRCREMLSQLHPENMSAWVILGRDHVRPLRELLPEHWLAGPWRPA
ncbi:MAG: cytidine deaminase [Planctomycetota bacterium]